MYEKKVQSSCFLKELRDFDGYMDSEDRRIVGKQLHIYMNELLSLYDRFFPKVAPFTSTIIETYDLIGKFHVQRKVAFGYKMQEVMQASRAISEFGEDSVETYVDLCFAQQCHDKDWEEILKLSLLAK